MNKWLSYPQNVMSLLDGDGANTGGALYNATDLVSHNFESFCCSFYSRAEMIHDLAQKVNVTIDPVGARDLYFRAAIHYRGADLFIHRIRPTRESTRCWINNSPPSSRPSLCWNQC